MTTESLGRAHDVSIVGDEDGFELHFSTDEGSYVVNVHSVAADLYWSARKEIGSWLSDGEEARRNYDLVKDDADAYDPSDPKHPNWHSVHADLWDARSEK